MLRTFAALKTLGRSRRHRTNHHAVVRSAIIPRLDALEPRLLLAKAAAQVTFVETPLNSGRDSLVVTGTSKNDTIIVNDDGKGAAGSIRIIANGSQTFTNTGPLALVSIVTGAGNDKVFYNNGGIFKGVREEFFIGSGTSKAAGVGSNGNVQVTANIGTIATDSFLLLDVFPATKGSTDLTVNDSGVIDGELIAAVGAADLSGNSNAKTGPVTFNFNSNALILADGKLVAAGLTGSNHNVLNENYVGTNQGDVSMIATSRGAKDTINANILMAAGSTGTVGKTTPTRVSTTGSTPKVRLAVFRGTDSTTSTGITAVLTTTSKKSVSAHTGNVIATTSGKDSVVS